MISLSKIRIRPSKPAFTLVEMVAVIAILVTLMTAGVSLLHSTGAQARKTGTDMLSGMIDQARTLAITSRTQVILAVAEPGDLPANDERCRVGLFKVDATVDWSDATKTPNPLKCTLLSRWQTLNTGIALIAGTVEKGTTPNLLDQPQITINFGAAKPVTVHAIAFNSRGGLFYPSGSGSIAIRIAEGAYRGTPSKATTNARGDQKAITENLLKIGRVTARPYRIDE